jgi:hypothetical protein
MGSALKALKAVVVMLKESSGRRKDVDKSNGVPSTTRVERVW